MPSIKQRLQKFITNAFASYEQQRADYSNSIGASTSSAPHTPRLRIYNDKSIINSIYTRIAIDVASVPVRHVKLDAQDRYLENIDSSLQECFDFEPNMDQDPRSFRQDLCMTMFDSGVAAVVPVDSVITKSKDDGGVDFDVLTMRVGRITDWYSKHVRVDLYNEATGLREQITLEKRRVAIIVNPLYSVMNEPNSTLQRLIRKLQLLDTVDEASSSGKLDLIIQLPYVVKSELRKQQAEKRRQEIEFQLKGSQYGIAYTDGTEKITQLNRPVENNLLKQIELLRDQLYGELGITADIMNGTADQKTMINYFNRTIEPILESIVGAEQRAFLGRRGYKRKERIVYFRNPFKLIPIEQLAEIADKFTRNEIFSSNELRGYMGVEPSKDPKADQLVNSNMPQPPPVAPGPSFDEMNNIMKEVFDGLSGELDKIGKQS